MAKSVYEMAVINMDPKDISSHESDLYLAVNPISTELVKSYIYQGTVLRFWGTDNRPWFELPFAFDPFWVKKLR